MILNLMIVWMIWFSLTGTVVVGIKEGKQSADGEDIVVLVEIHHLDCGIGSGQGFD
jgi:hypothetical protein